MLFTTPINNEKFKPNEEKVENKNNKLKNSLDKLRNVPNEECQISKLIDPKDINKNIIYMKRGKELLAEIFRSDLNRGQAVNYGLFRLIDKDGNIYLSSKRDFTVNDEFKIVNDDGRYLTGHLRDYNNIPESSLKPEILDFSKKFLPIINKTNEINIEANLNTEDEVKEETKFNPLDPNTYTMKRSIIIYDKLGHDSCLDVYFLKNAVNSWRIISINKESNEKYDPNYIFYNRANNKIHVMGSGIVIKSNFDPNLKSKILFKCNNMTTNKDIQTYFKDLISDGSPIKSLNHYDVCPNGDIVGVFSDDTRGKLGFAEMIQLPKDVKKCLEIRSISNLNESLIKFLKEEEFDKNIKNKNKILKKEKQN